MRRTSPTSKTSTKTSARVLFFLCTSLAFTPSFARADRQPDWSEGAPVPAGGNSNPYGLSPSDLEHSIGSGKLHAQVYPVEVTGLLPPYRPFATALNGDSNNPLTQILHGLAAGLTNLKSFDQVLAELGLHPYPASSDTGVYSFPVPDESRIPERRVGFGTIHRPDGEGFTISCAACHSSNLFGKTVLGLTNRFPRANETFLAAKQGVHLVTPKMLNAFAGATTGEMRLYQRVQEAMPFIGVKRPAVLGLDTSLAQVALSLNRRATDEYAERDPHAAANPRPDPLDDSVADSKPAVWWNVKYKNRWLSDGSVVSGNPVYTNLLWNEIGRGVDLHELETWLESNPDVIRDLTSAVFSSEAPRFTDFFPAERFDLVSAKRGETVFRQRCARCHGNYDKAWELESARSLAIADQLKTWRVRYKEQTSVVDVGTDPGRWQGMASLERLNHLAISKKIGVVIESQQGYVAPPLVGIWARWPYFHNNSVPSLCALLTRHEDRPTIYRAVEANDPERDFDVECNGYPRNPAGRVRAVFSASRPGMRNIGHDEGIFLKSGRELLTIQEKFDLIRFLQTL